MSKTDGRVRGSIALADHPSPNPDEVRRQLRNILASPAFHGSKRCQQFLEYVCEKSLAGQAAGLKERTIAVEVFGRQPESDLAEDTIVRVGAREVRKRLAQYYVTPEGVAAEVRIDLYPGGYNPEFRYSSLPSSREEGLAPSTPSPAVAVPAQTEVALVMAEPLAPSSRRRRILIYAAIALVVLAAGFAIFKLAAPVSANVRQFNLFWEPVLRAPEPVLIAVAHPIVYHPSRRAQRLNAESRVPEEIPTQHPLQVPAKSLDGSDLIPVLNQYVGFGDLVAANEVSNMLSRRAHEVRVRMASSVGFEDLRKTPTFLIGAITNHWTMELQQSWRFRFRQDSELHTFIADTEGDHQSWSIPQHEDGSSPEDYILVCRIHNSVTGGLLVVAAGLKQFGTEAAGRLLADPDQLGVILQTLPAGWESRNVQFVLHARVIGNAPALPEVVAHHVW